MNFQAQKVLAYKLIVLDVECGKFDKGDSSGGGFALALAQKMKEENNDKASQVILIYPWLDITLKNTNISSIESEDLVLGISGLQKAGKLYAGDSDPNDYLLSLINGQIEGLSEVIR